MLGKNNCEEKNTNPSLGGKPRSGDSTCGGGEISPSPLRGCRNMKKKQVEYTKNGKVQSREEVLNLSKKSFDVLTPAELDRIAREHRHTDARVDSSSGTVEVKCNAV